MAKRREVQLALVLGAGLLAPAMAAAQVEIAEYWISADTNVRIPSSDGPGVTLADDRSEIILLPDGTGTAQAPNGVSDLFGADVDAFHRTFRRISLDTARTIGGMLVEPGDVFYISGGTPVIEFDADAAGVPDGVNLDAITLDPSSGALKVSFDRFFEHPSVTFVLPGDLVELASGQIQSIAVSGYVFPAGVNVDAAHQLDDTLYLLSVDVDTQLPGASGPVTVRDHDVILFDDATGDFEVLLSLAEASHPSWVPADLDALWAERAPQGGQIRILDAFREVQESVGTVTLRVERFGGSEGSAGIFLDSIGGTATEDVDFSGDVAYDGLWLDGADGVRTISVVDIIDDGLQEPIEQFTVELSIFGGTATVGTPSVATIRILDDDGQNLFLDGFES